MFERDGLGERLAQLAADETSARRFPFHGVPHWLVPFMVPEDGGAGGAGAGGSGTGGQGDGAASGSGSGGSGGQDGSGQGGARGAGAGASDDDDPGTWDRDRAASTIRAQRDNERKLQRQIADLNKKLQGFENEKLSEAEKLQNRVKELEGQLTTAVLAQRDARLEVAVAASAAKHGALYPELLVDRIRARVEFDDDGRPKNVDALVAQVRKDYPALFRAGSGSGDGGAGGSGGRNGGGTDSDMNALIRRAAGRA